MHLKRKNIFNFTLGYTRYCEFAGLSTFENLYTQKAIGVLSPIDLIFFGRNRIGRRLEQAHYP